MGDIYNNALRELLIALLEETQRRRCISKSIMLRKIRNLKLLNMVMLKLVNEGLIKIIDDKIHIVSKRVQIAIKCIENGVSEFRVSKYLSWKEFEDFVKSIFESFNYKTYTNVYIKSMNKRYEIDVVALSKKCVFVVDVKHWLKPLSLKEAERISELQYERAKAFMKGELFKDFNCEYVIPLIVTLVSQKFSKTMFSAIVSVTYLNSFILEFEKHIDEVPCIKRWDF